MHRSTFVFAASVGFFSCESLAQESISQDDDVLVLNRIMIVQPEPEEGGIDVDSDDIGRINPSDLQDLFAAEPTVTVGSSIPASQKLFVNGVEETNLAVSIDGSRQNNKIFHHNATNLIDPSLLKAVRIDPGVAPADAGPGALAGSIAFETVDPGDLLLAGRDVGGFFKTEYETNGEVFTNSGSAYGQKDGFELLGFLKYADGDVREDGDGTVITGSGTSLLSGLGKVAYQAPTDHRFEFSYEAVHDDEARPYRADIGQIIGGRPVPLTRNYDLLRQNFVFTYTDEAPEGWLDPTVKLAYSVTDLSLPEDEQISEGKTDSINGKVENRFGFDRGSVTAGFDFFADTAETDYQFFPDPSFNEAGEEKAQNIGLYAQARLDLTDRWRVSTGGRGDFQHFEGVDGYSTNEAGLSGNVATDFDVTDNLTASAGYSRVWAGIPLAENFIINPGWTYPDDTDPVTSDNFFAGLRAEFDGAFEGAWVDGKVFRTEINDARTPDYTQGPALKKDIRSQGYELGAGYSWGEGFVRVGYADIESEVDGNPADSYSGRYLTTPIGQIVTLEAAHTFTDIGLTIGGNAQVVFEETGTYDLDTGMAGQPLQSYQVFNAFAEYQPERFPSLTLRAQVNNIFDETYASRGTYGQEFGTVIPLNEPGRSFRLSGTIRF